ncbi:hypothetical protein ACG74X_19565 [Marivita sp. S0852]|uniref:hypothetical protein n=1 Tax=Marivita sp. S0852 TaxID=3373893 RepID=UPI003981D35D
MTLRIGKTLFDIHDGGLALEAAMADYLAPDACDVDGTATTQITCVLVPGLTHDAPPAGAAGEVRPKKGFTYQRRRLGPQSVYLSGQGYHNDRHIVTQTGRQFTLIAGTRLYLMLNCLRLMREISRRDWDDTGGHLLHAAAAVDSDGRALLIIGNKGAGKSSLLMRLCQLGYRYLSNDKCLISLDGSGAMEVTEWPMPARLGTGTLLAVLGAGRRLDFTRLSRPQKLRPEDSADLRINQKVELTRREILDHFGLQGAGSRHGVAGCLFPAIDPQGAAATVQSVAGADHRAVIVENITCLDDHYPDAWLGLGQAVTPARRAALAAALAALPCHRVAGDFNGLGLDTLRADLPAKTHA